jgi:hypothetical protein
VTRRFAGQVFYPHVCCEGCAICAWFSGERWSALPSNRGENVVDSSVYQSGRSGVVAPTTALTMRAAKDSDTMAPTTLPQVVPHAR